MKTSSARRGGARDVVILIAFCLGAIITGCGSSESKGWEMPDAKKTYVTPIPGLYSFDQTGCFGVAEDAQNGEKYVLFSSDCHRYDRITIREGAFSSEWGAINGTHCPTDAYAISGSFLTETRAEGTIKYGYDCRVTREAKFVAEYVGGESS